VRANPGSGNFQLNFILGGGQDARLSLEIRGHDLDEAKATEALKAAEEARRHATDKQEVATVEAELASLAAQLAAIRKLRQRK